MLVKKEVIILSNALFKPRVFCSYDSKCIIRFHQSIFGKILYVENLEMVTPIYHKLFLEFFTKISINFWVNKKVQATVYQHDMRWLLYLQTLVKMGLTLQ